MIARVLGFATLASGLLASMVDCGDMTTYKRKKNLKEKDAEKLDNCC